MNNFVENIVSFIQKDSKTLPSLLTTSSNISWTGAFDNVRNLFYDTVDYDEQDLENVEYSSNTLALSSMNQDLRNEIIKLRLAAPLLPEILLTVTRIAEKSRYSWEFCDAPSVYVPSNCRSIARQFIRCVFHQLAPNGIFSLLFQMELSNKQREKFFETIVSALLDFSEVNPSVPVLLFLQEMNERKTWTSDLLEVSLLNLSCYLKFVPYETPNIWTFVFPQAETFLRRLWTLSANPTKSGSSSSAYKYGFHGGASNSHAATNCLQTGGGKSNEKIEKSTEVTVVLRQTDSLFSIMASLLRMSGIQNSRSILDPLGKLISHTIQNSNVSFHSLLNVCHLCNKTFAKEKERYQLTKAVVFELISAVKFKSSIPDTNFLLLTNFVLQDCGGEITNRCGPGRDFLADVHSLSKVKSHVKGMNIGLNEDTLGGIIKASLAQYMAIEISRGGNGSRPREFLDCSVTISLKHQRPSMNNNPNSFNLNSNVLEDGLCTPIPLEASCHIADHVQVILAGFAEQSKSSVVHMCSLFHAFILCQLWTVYLEQTIMTLQPRDESQVLAGSILLDFWGKVTPGILQLVSHSKVLAEMVNLHFLGLMEAFMECNSMILGKLMPLWIPVLFAYQSTLPDHVRVRLQAIQDYKPQSHGDLEEESTHNEILKKWLQRLQFKMGQIEMQASHVTQFFTV
ncbi:UNC79 [Lepeophtheirus salmonis]|uniref:UNC79 n=1 Tax=Lepeophtheirus salmonis TaxID=72036 RepID=A0A7R8HDR6_LEPSM|nr:UNC79 [Lepeophtheirus salmonis]CAF3040076.1 UNC79 [Lepeophtheirus salmonis]